MERVMDRYLRGAQGLREGTVDARGRMLTDRPLVEVERAAALTST